MLFTSRHKYNVFYRETFGSAPETPKIPQSSKKITSGPIQEYLTNSLPEPVQLHSKELKTQKLGAQEQLKNSLLGLKNNQEEFNKIKNSIGPSLCVSVDNFCPPEQRLPDFKEILKQITSSATLSLSDKSSLINLLHDRTTEFFTQKINQLHPKETIFRVPDMGGVAPEEIKLFQGSLPKGFTDREVYTSVRIAESEINADTILTSKDKALLIKKLYNKYMDKSKDITNSK